MSTEPEYEYYVWEGMLHAVGEDFVSEVSMKTGKPWTNHEEYWRKDFIAMVREKGRLLTDEEFKTVMSIMNHRA